MKKILIAIIEIVATIVIVAGFCICGVFAAKAIGKSDAEVEDAKRCMDEIVPQYEWDQYIYTYQPAKICTHDKKWQKGYYYTLIVYAEQEDGKLHRYEWLCRVRPDDVDCDLVRNDICEEY